MLNLKAGMCEKQTNQSEHAKISKYSCLERITDEDEIFWSPSHSLPYFFFLLDLKLEVWLWGEAGGLTLGAFNYEHNFGVPGESFPSSRAPEKYKRVCDTQEQSYWKASE